MGQLVRNAPCIQERRRENPVGEDGVGAEGADERVEKVYVSLQSGKSELHLYCV